MDIVLIDKRMTEELENMTIPELKAALAKHSLETTGKRSDLLSRLTNHFKKKVVKTTETAKTVKSPTKTVTKSQKASTKSAKSPTSPSSNTPSRAVSASPKSPNSPKSPKSPKSRSPSAEPKKSVTALTMEERLKLRAKRFNLEQKPTTSKIVTTASKTKVKLVLNEDLEVLKKRSERFGIPLVTQKTPLSAKVTTNTNTKKKIDFVVDDDEMARRKKRLERFSSN